MKMKSAFRALAATACAFFYGCTTHKLSPKASDNLDYGMPSSDCVVIERNDYALGHKPEWKQAAWVSYRLTKEEVQSNVCRRVNSFAKDPLLSESFSVPSDYTRSGYDRGHLAPAADMSWSEEAMRESFYMSNMSPQAPMLNRGIWKKLEMWVRDAAAKEESVVVVTGPVVCSNDVSKTIGKNEVIVPSAFYKVVYDETPPKKMIGFIMPNEGSTNSIALFAVSVDKVEEVTGLDFFSEIEDSRENELELMCDIDMW